jgi:hypothetical protein
MQNPMGLPPNMKISKYIKRVQIPILKKTGRILKYLKV